jgi:hypothetical protein
MPFTAAQLDHIANGQLDYNLKGKPQAQTVQDKPLLKAMKSAQKEFSGGKGNITGSVKGNYDSYFAGFTHDDTVAYKTPANSKRWTMPWREVHGGLQITMTELKIAGISVVDTNGEETSNHTEQEKHELFNLLDDKLDDMREGMARDHNEYYWGDGTADPKGPVGITYFIVDDPTLGVCEGIDRATNSWWRNRAKVGVAGRITQDAANQIIARTLNSELRQLRRFGGKPTLWLAGSGFLDALELEMRKNGTFTQDGFNREGGIDLGAADARLQGNKIVYDPSLDDLGFSKRLYVIDPKRLFPYVMEGEDYKRHNPSRPHDVYAIYKGVTWTGNLVATQMNCHGVYEVN